METMTVRRRMYAIALAVIVLAVPAAALAGQGAGPAKTPAKSKPATPASKPAVTLSPAIVSHVWTGDFDGMVKRRLSASSRPTARRSTSSTRAYQRGAVNEVAVKFEETINTKLKTTNATKVHVVVVPTSRDDLYDALVKGAATSSWRGSPSRRSARSWWTSRSRRKRRQRDRRDRPGRAGHRHGRRICPADRRGAREEHPVREPAEGERHVEAAGQGAV